LVFAAWKGKPGKAGSRTQRKKNGGEAACGGKKKLLAQAGHEKRGLVESWGAKGKRVRKNCQGALKRATHPKKSEHFGKQAHNFS